MSCERTGPPVAIPALATTTSRPPSACGGAVDRRLHLVELRDVAFSHERSLTAARRDLSQRVGLEPDERDPALCEASFSASAAPMPRAAPVISTRSPRSTDSVWGSHGPDDIA